MGDMILAAGAAYQAANEGRSGGPDDLPYVPSDREIAEKEQLATREREARQRKLRLMEMDDHAVEVAH